MERFIGLMTGVALLVPTACFAADDVNTRATEALKRYYEGRLRQPFIITDPTQKPKKVPAPWAEPIKQLSAAKGTDRREAASFLRALLDQALRHEKSGKAPWRATPYWGGGAEVPARDLRGIVAEELAKITPPSEALTLFRWYLDNETADKFLPFIMTALGKIDAKEANDLRAKLASQPHENALVTAAGDQPTRRSQASLAGRHPHRPLSPPPSRDSKGRSKAQRSARRERPWPL